MKTGDIVKFKLDLSKNKERGEFICLVNDQETIRYINVERSTDIGYQMFIRLFNEKDCVSLLSYEELHPFK